MGTQSKIVQQIREKKADYIVTLKANHPTLLSQIQQWFTQTKACGFTTVNHDYYQKITKEHHRTENRGELLLSKRFNCFIKSELKMGEAKRRKKLDPNYGKSKPVKNISLSLKLRQELDSIYDDNLESSDYLNELKSAKMSVEEFKIPNETP